MILKPVRIEHQNFEQNHSSRRRTFASKAALINAFERRAPSASRSPAADLRAFEQATPSAKSTPSAHTERHTEQIEEVEPATGYPAK